MLEQLDLILRQDCALKPGLPVVAGISGGPDSMCMLDVLHKLRYEVIVAHFNHKLRPEADIESAAVASLACRLNLPFVIESADVCDFANREMLSIEEAGRILRYRFLFSQARKNNAQVVAVGHTADDQVETVLMHLLRGAGLIGLKGMTYRSLLSSFDPEIPIVRPLLAIWRTEIEAYCRIHNLKPFLDPTNADQRYFRNRLRHVLIPDLETYNPRFKETLLRTTQALQGDSAVLEEVLGQEMRICLVEIGDGFVAFDREKLANVSVGLRRRLICRGAEYLYPNGRDFGFSALERATTFVVSPVGKRLDLGCGLYLFAEGGKVYIASYEANLPFAHWPQVDHHVIVNGPRCELGNGWVFSIEELPLTTAHSLKNDYSTTNQKNSEMQFGTSNWSVWLDADLTGRRLKVRPCRAGDRFQPLGMNGQSVKLSDFFINNKLPKRARAKWPLVCAEEEIAWVPGFRLAHPFRITDKSIRALHLTLDRESSLESPGSCISFPR